MQRAMRAIFLLPAAIDADHAAHSPIDTGLCMPHKSAPILPDFEFPEISDDAPLRRFRLRRFLRRLMVLVALPAISTLPPAVLYSPPPAVQDAHINKRRHHAYTAS